MKRVSFCLLLAACHATPVLSPKIRIDGAVTVSVDADLTGLEVTALGPTPQHTRTDSAGAYAFVDLQPGPYSICVVVPGSAEGESCVSVVAADDTLAPTLAATPLGQIAGRFVDGAGLPVRDVTIGVRGEAPIAVTDGDGRFVLRGVRSGRRYLFAARVGYMPLLEQAADVAWRAETELPPIPLAVETQPISDVRGRIELVGEPSASPTIVTFAPLGLSTECDEGGHFSTLLPTGVYTMTVSAERRRFELPRLLVGNGRAFLVENGLSELDTLRIPVGERLPAGLLRTTPLRDGALLAHERTSLGTVRTLEIVDAQTGALDYAVSLPTMFPLLDVVGDYAVIRKPNSTTGHVDFVRLDLRDCSETGSIANASGSIVSWPLSEGGTILAFDGQGTLRRLSDGQPLVSYGLASARVSRVDADAFAALVTADGRTQLELRALADGSLLTAFGLVGPWPSVVRLGDVRYLIDAALSELVPSGTGSGFTSVRRMDDVQSATPYPPFFLLTPTSGTSKPMRLWRPSDDRLVAAPRIVVVPPLAFLSANGAATESVRHFDAPEVELFALSSSQLSFVAPSGRFYFAAADVTDLGAHWRAVEVATATVIDLGFGERPVELEGRIFMLTDRVGRYSPGTLREIFPDGTNAVIATNVTEFLLSPALGRVAYASPDMGGIRLYVQSLLTGAREWVGYGAPLAWWNEAQLKWKATSSTVLGDATLRETSFVTRFGP